MVFNQNGHLLMVFIFINILCLTFLVQVNAAAKNTSPASNWDCTKNKNPSSNWNCTQSTESTQYEPEHDGTAGHLWCKNQEKFRNGAHRDCGDNDLKFHEDHLKSFFSLFAIITYGAAIRSILKATGLPLPYTVILMISGLLLGLISSYYCKEMQAYTAIARTPPKVILFLFLPVLIFESAFSIPVHTFMRSAGQILVAAFPGMVIATFSTALVCFGFLREYNFSFNEASLFGSIVSATDPVAVVAILRELGTSEMLSVMIEGESLLNDGVAILFYEIFEGILIKPDAPLEEIAVDIVQKFFWITLGGPIFGWIMAKISIFCLGRIFNDETVEVTITLVAAYLTYFIGDHILGVSGVMAVVALGLTMSSERTCISPEVEESVHHFWEMLGYLANTVLFVFVGIIIAESALTKTHFYDFYYLIFLYVSLNILRFGMLIVLSPILSRIGYGLKWENMIIMMWGGLRGAVGLCLALEVYSGELCLKNEKIGRPFLFQTAGIVVLTLVVNGTTTKMLLDLLKLTEISVGRLQDMASATKSLIATQIRMINTLKHDRFFADSSWEIVVKFTAIENPYIKKIPAPTVKDVSSIISMKLEEHDNNITRCPECHTKVIHEPSADEMKVLTEEARCRLIKALKVSFWKQFERGILLEVSTQILSGIADEFEDRELKMIHAEDLQKYWVVRGVFAWLRRYIFKSIDTFHNEPTLRKPDNKCVRPFWFLATRTWFDGLITFIVMLNLIPIFWELAYYSHEHDFEFFIVNIVFMGIYILEFLIKVIGRGCKDYFKSKWNWIDFVVLIFGIVEVCLRAMYITDETQDWPPWAQHTFRTLRGLRMIRICRLFRYILPKLQFAVQRRINRQLFLGYDIAKGFVYAIDEVLKHIHFVSSNKKIVQKLKVNLERQRLATIREMGFLQKENPGIAIAVKTRHASRAVLNQMRDHLMELNEDGLVDEKSNMLLMSIIEENMKKLWHSPSSIPPSSAEVHLANIPWCANDESILDFVLKNATISNFNVGDIICDIGDEPKGIYVIVSGLVKVSYEPTSQTAQDMENGVLPNTEVYLDISFTHESEDFFSTGTILGEWGILTGQRRAARVVCETVVMAYFISKDVLQQGFETFSESHDSLESKMWRSCGIRLGAAILSHQPAYKQWTVGRIRLHLERSVVPVEPKYETLKFPAFVSDVVLLQGQVTNYHRRSELYTAPCALPKSCVRINTWEKSAVPPRMLIVAYEDIDQALISPSAESLHDYISKATTKGLPKEARGIRERRLSLGVHAKSKHSQQSSRHRKKSLSEARKERDRRPATRS